MTQLISHQETNRQSILLYPRAARLLMEVPCRFIVTLRVCACVCACVRVWAHAMCVHSCVGVRGGAGGRVF